MDVENRRARNRLEAAEEEFAKLAPDGRGLVDQSNSTYRFHDGTEVTGVKAAAAEAERQVNWMRAQIRSNRNT